MAGAHFRGEEKDSVIVAQWSVKNKCNEGGNVEDTSTRGHQGFNSQLLFGLPRLMADRLTQYQDSTVKIRRDTSAHPKSH